MGEEILSYLIQRITTTPIQTFPYPHFHTESCVPEKFYQELIGNIPDASYFSSLESYPQRSLFNLIPEKLSQLSFTSFLF